MLPKRVLRLWGILPDVGHWTRRRSIMNGLHWRLKLSIWILAGSILAASGCQQFRLPAIDPSGQRIFLPAPASTRLVHPSDSQCRGLGNIIPKPAWQSPPTPPPCAEAPPESPPGTKIPVAPKETIRPRALTDGIPGKILVTPTRMFATVGSEVVLIAGLCGEDGYFVTRQPIEWMLSQDSVGQIVDVSDRNGIWPSSKKVTGDYTVTRTAYHSKVLTRGTPSVTDDIVQQKGQAWISLTSASEGTSYVTVVASKGASWPQRRHTSTIYWINAQWALPNPTTVAANRPHALTTTITRTGTDAAVVGWIVRYEITGGTSATFAPGGSNVIEVRTDENGQAIAQRQPAGNQPGTTQVRIQIIRPADAHGDAPKTQVGEGFTSVTWSAPGLALRAAGPSTGAVDSTLVYRVEVSNPGDLLTHGVVLSDVLPPGWKFVSSNPAAQIFGDRPQWQLGDLAPQTTRAIEVNVRPQAGGNIRYRFHVKSADGLQAEAYVDTQVSRPALTLNVTGPQTA